MTDFILTETSDKPLSSPGTLLQAVTPVPGLPDATVGVTSGEPVFRDVTVTSTLEDGHAALLHKVVAKIAERKRPMRPVTVLLDGPSGAGKTWFAAVLADDLGCQVTHLDEFYPGWTGLARGSDMVAEQVLRDTNPGYWRWNWSANMPGDWVSLDARDDVVVEGAGAISQGSIAAAAARGTVVTVMITGQRDARFSRATQRDPDYEPWFKTWEQQEQQHFAALATAGVVPDVVWAWANS